MNIIDFQSFTNTLHWSLVLLKVAWWLLTNREVLVWCYCVVLSSSDSCRNIHIYILDTYRRNDYRRSNKRRSDKDAGRKMQEDFFNNIFLPLTLLQGFERVVQGLHVRGCWRPNINFIFWPHCYDHHVVSFLFFSAVQPEA